MNFQRTKGKWARYSTSFFSDPQKITLVTYMAKDALILYFKSQLLGNKTTKHYFVKENNGLPNGLHMDFELLSERYVNNQISDMTKT